MTMLYNTDPAPVDITVVRGDTIDMTFHVTVDLIALARKFYVTLNGDPAEGSANNLNDLRIQVRRKDGLLLKEWLSGVSPSNIIVTNNTYHLYDPDGFLESGHFDYEVEEHDSDGYFCIQRGSWWVKKEITI